MYLYLIRETGTDFIKVGRSVDPVRRLSDLQIGTPHELVLHAFLPESQSLSEYSLHHAFSHLRIRGEWFSGVDEIESYLVTNFEEFREHRKYFKDGVASIRHPRINISPKLQAPQEVIAHA